MAWIQTKNKYFFNPKPEKWTLYQTIKQKIIFYLTKNEMWTSFSGSETL